MRRLPLTLTLLAMALAVVGLLFGDSLHRLLALMAAVIALSLTLRRCRCPRSARLIALPGLALPGLVIISFILPSGWVGYDGWSRLFTVWPGANGFYAIRPSMLITTALALLALPPLIPRRTHLLAPLLWSVALLLILAQLIEQLACGFNEDAGLTPPITLGMGLLLAAEAVELHRQTERYRRPVLVARSAALVVVMVTLTLWHFQNSQNLYRVNHIALGAGDGLSEALGSTLSIQNDAMRRFANSWQHDRGLPAPGDWQHRSQLWLDDFEELNSIAWFDHHRRLRRVNARGNRERPATTDTPAVSEALQQVFGYGQQSTAGLINTDATDSSIVFYFPVPIANSAASRGAIAFTLSLPRLFQQLSAHLRDTRDYLFSVSLGDQLLYRIGNNQRLSSDRYCNLMTVGDNDFTLCAQPTLDRLFTERASLPELLLLSGLVFALMLYLVMYYHQRLRSKHNGVINANRQLRNEVEARIALQTEVEWLAHHDELTRLPNRRYFTRWANEQPDDKGGAIMLIDIDHFKSVNDQLGHARGDHYLRCVAEVARRPVEANGGLLARYGGEEFVACLPALDDDAVHVCAERIRREVHLLELEQPHHGGWLTVSIGFDSADGHFDIDALIESADSALYHAKRSGRDRVMRA